VNELDNLTLNKSGFAYQNLLAQDRWETWTPTYVFTTASGLTVTGRFKVLGKQCFWQIKSTGTSLATTAGTDYIDLPIAAQGLAGVGEMSNDTTNISVGVGHVDVATSRFYTPTQGASSNDFTFAGWHEV